MLSPSQSSFTQHRVLQYRDGDWHLPVGEAQKAGFSLAATQQGYMAQAGLYDGSVGVGGGLHPGGRLYPGGAMQAGDGAMQAGGGAMQAGGGAMQAEGGFTGQAGAHLDQQLAGLLGVENNNEG